MAPGKAVLKGKAEKLELKKFIGPAQCVALNELITNAYSSRHPEPSDYNCRTDLIQVFNKMAKEIFGNADDCPVVVEFGSFLMDMFTATSDLDLSINFRKDAGDFPREKKKQVLRKIAKKLYLLQARGHVSGVYPVLNAKVPIVKVTDRGTGVECDISVENRDGVAKSQIMRMISSIDERFKKLGFLMKVWATSHNINSSRDRTLNSLSIICLVALHLQTRDPPILPPFSAIFRDGTDPSSVMRTVQKYLNYGEQNKESLAELFVTLLLKLESVKRLWPKGLCASTYEGSWISKIWESGVGCISVEDFTEQSQNVARAVGAPQVEQIYGCIHSSLADLIAFGTGHLNGVKLMERLFGKKSIPSHEANVAKKSNKRKADLPMSSYISQTKKMQSKEGWENAIPMPSSMQFSWGNGNHSENGKMQFKEGWGNAIPMPFSMQFPWEGFASQPHYAPLQNSLSGQSYAPNPTAVRPSVAPNYAPPNVNGNQGSLQPSFNNLQRPWQPYP